MIRVMIVEDEPTAMCYIARLVQTRCSDAEIVSQVEDGMDAIEVLKDTQVDIVITDIQMALLNGIELALWISRNKPSILTLIVSGHSDFEYAKDAITAGVAEYLLKPIRPSEFETAMEKLGGMARRRRREMREKWLIQNLASHTDAYDARFWPQTHLMLGTVRRGGVSCDAFRTAGPFPYPPNLPEDSAVVYARNETEICFAAPFQDEREAAGLAAALACGAPYYTALFTIVPAGEGCAFLPAMLETAHKIAVPGLKQVKRYTVGAMETPPPAKEQKLINNLRYAISNSQLEKIKLGLCAVFELWEAESCPLTHAEITLTYLMRLMLDHVPSGDSKIEVFELVSKICCQASDYLDMLRKTWAYCEGLYYPLARESRGGQLISHIEDYIRGHLSEPLSIQRISDVFTICGSYLSQLFRKYVKMSFVEYITHLRVEEAKRIMTEFPDMPVKTIAEQLGFSDQFYFSKVFRSITCVSPSEFKDTYRHSQFH